MPMMKSHTGSEPTLACGIWYLLVFGVKFLGVGGKEWFVNVDMVLADQLVLKAG